MSMDPMTVQAMDEESLGDPQDLMQADDDVGRKESAVGDVVELTADQGVKKKFLVLGTGWEQPEKDDKVFVHYTGRLEDGTVFDSSVERGEPFSFTLGHSQVIKGWDVAVATMKKGEKAELTLSAAYAYGDAGSPPKIPAAATLIFEVELLRWESVNDISDAKDGSLMKVIVTEGDLDVWDRPQAPDIVTVVASARAAGGDAAASPVLEEQEVEFTVRDGWFCPAIKLAVESMKKGERVRIKAQPQWCFGAEGREGVPPNTALEIDLHLKRVKTVKDVVPGTPGAVTKVILKDGVAYKTPNDAAEVVVSWTGRLADGTTFDEVSKRAIKMEDDAWPCEALELAVASMKDTEEADVIVNDPAFGFGAAGAPDAGVPAGAVVTYNLRLHSFVNGPDTYDMSGADKLERATSFKTRGNAAFKAGKVNKARRMYEKVETLLSMDHGMSESEKARGKELKASSALNLAAVALKQGSHRDAAAQCTKVLERDSGNVKALYRRSQARAGLGEVVEADMDLKAALLIEPKSADLLAAQRKLKAQMKAQNKKDAKLFGAMFSKVGSMYKDQPDAPPASAEPAAAPLEPMEDEPLYAGEAAAPAAGADAGKGAAAADVDMQDAAADTENVNANP